MKILEDRLYSKDHEWVLVSGSTARVGITDYAQDALGDVDVKLAGKSLQRTRRIFRADDLDAAGWAGGFAEVTADTTFLVIVVA